MRESTFKSHETPPVEASIAASSPAGNQLPLFQPEDAYRRALDAGMLVHRARPLNCETPLHILTSRSVLPNQRFYVRSHFDIPQLDTLSWRLNVIGLVEKPLSLSIREIEKMPSSSRSVTLECAGNGRSLMNPRVTGEQWNLGAVNTAEWKGVSLGEVLDRAGVKASATEVVFRGADSGKVNLTGETIRFERSLSIEHARAPQVLLAYAMNQEKLPMEHGYPLRLIVPGWYAMASVKWLAEIEVIEGVFRGHYQTEAYVFDRQRGEQVREPVSLQRVRSLITEPRPDSEVQRGSLLIRGVAWSGAAQIAKVEVRVGDGIWKNARLLGGKATDNWQEWEFILRVDRPAVLAISARATDLAGRIQPESPEWNRLGYGNNVIHNVWVQVR